MAITKFLARDLTFEIGEQGTGGDAWLEVKGLQSLSHSPSSTDADTTDFESDGHAEHLKAERGDTWTITGFTLEDVMTGERDPGQAAVEALAQLGGPAGIGLFRITSPGGNQIEFDASAEVTLAGGGTNDAAAWNATVKTSGAMRFS
jgi:hypothetical protein